jgi:hypothetical protein
MSESVPVPSPSSSSLNVLRASFFDLHRDLPPLLNTIAATNEQFVQAGHAVTEASQAHLEQALSTWSKEWEQRINETSSGSSPASDRWQQLEKSLSAAEASLLRRLRLSTLAACQSSCAEFLYHRCLSALRGLASPSMAVGVLHTASLLSAKQSMHTLHDVIKARVRAMVDKRIQLACKAIRNAIRLAFLSPSSAGFSMPPVSALASPPSCAVVARPASPSPPSAAAAALTPCGALVPSSFPSVIQREVALRAQHLHQCLCTAAALPSSTPGVTVLPALLRALLPLSICVAASQAAPVYGAQALVQTFREGSDDGQAGLLTQTRQLLQRIESTMALPASPSQELDECKQLLRTLDEASTAMTRATGIDKT